MLNSLSGKVVRCLLNENVIKDDQTEVYQYGFKLLFSYVINVVWILCLGIVLNELFLAVVYILILATVRTQIGGYHAPTYLKCFFMYNVGFVGVKLVSSFCSFLNVGVIPTTLLLLSVIFIIYKYAPILHTRKMCTEEKHEAKKKGLVRTVLWGAVMYLCWNIDVRWSYSILTVLVFSVIFMMAEQLMKEISKHFQTLKE